MLSQTHFGAFQFHIAAFGEALGADDFGSKRTALQVSACSVLVSKWPEHPESSYWYECLSVCLSVRHIPVFCLDE